MYIELNCGDINRSPTVQIFNPKGVNVATNLHELLLANEIPQLSTPFLRILPYSEETTYFSMIKEVEKDASSGRLAGVLIFSQVDKKVHSKDLRPPRGFFDAERDLDLCQIPVIGLTHADAMNLLFTEGNMNTSTSENKGILQYVTIIHIKYFTSRVHYFCLGYLERLGNFVGSGVRKVGAVFGYPSSFHICETFTVIDWFECTPQTAYNKVEAKVKDWELVVSASV